MSNTHMGKEFNDKAVEAFNHMSLTSKFKVVGSAAIKKSIYFADFDLFETVRNKSERAIYRHFRALFKLFRKSPTTLITDFKCGVDANGDPLRWDYASMMRGENQGVKFTDAVKQRSMVKLDVVLLLNGRFLEITEVYSIFIRHKSNYQRTKEEHLQEIIEEYITLVNNKNWFKALKKVFLYLKHTGEAPKIQQLLLTYFNQPIGLLYRAKTDIETILEVLEHQKVKVADVRVALQALKETVSAFDVKNNLERISKYGKKRMRRPLEKQRDLLLAHLNREANRFIKRHKI